MSFSNKLENTYLNILRYVILIVATVSLVAVAIAGSMAINAAFSSPPKEPEKIKFEDRTNDLKKGFTIGNFKKDSPTKTEVKPQAPDKASEEKQKDDSFRALLKDSISKIADNFIIYEREIRKAEMDKGKLENFIANYPFNSGLRREKQIITFYFDTLASLTGDLANQTKEIAKLPEEKRINPDKLLEWHLQQVNRAVETVDEARAQRDIEFLKQQEAYAGKKASTYTYISAAGGAFGIFLVIIMLFIMVKIERNLRPLQQMVDSGKNTSA